MLHESGAILCFLATRFGKSEWYPGERSLLLQLLLRGGTTQQ